MDGAAVFRLISLIPDRMPRSQTGSAFDGVGFERAELLARFLGWLGPLNPTSKEEQQLLGVRTGSAKVPVEGEEPLESLEPLEPMETAEEVEDSPVRLPGAGTQIAA